MNSKFFRGLGFAIPLGLIGWAVGFALALTLFGCGGGGSPPAPVAIPKPAPASKDGYGLLVYVGDDVAYWGCDPAYNAPLPDFQQDVIDGACVVAQNIPAVEVLRRFPTALAQNPKAVVILAGFTDIHEPAPSTAPIIEMVQEAQAQGVIVILATLPTTAGYDAEVQAWNAEIRSISKSYGTQLADLYYGLAHPETIKDIIELSNGVPPPKPYYDAAGRFPNWQGYGIIWDVICESTDEDGVTAP
jgi:hypothetical protein